MMQRKQFHRGYETAYVTWREYFQKQVRVQAPIKALNLDIYARQTRISVGSCRNILKIDYKKLNRLIVI